MCVGSPTAGAWSSFQRRPDDEFETDSWLDTVPGFPDRLRENPPRQGFFEHPEYLAVRVHLPAPWQDILDLAYYSGWRKQEILGLTWEEIDEAGGVIRLSPGHRPSVRRRSRPGHRVRVGPRSRRRGGPTRPNTGTRQTIAAYKPPRPAGVRHAHLPLR